MNKKAQAEHGEKKETDLHGAAIINPDGSETAITDDMIKAACDNIESSSADDEKSGKDSH